MTALGAILVITNLGFTAWFDTERRIPLCVEYDLEPAEVVRIPRIPHDFTDDPRTGCTNVNAAYSHSGYDRGHMAPAADFNWDRKALDETYRFSNIVPQAPALNRGRWLDAEETVRRMAVSGTVHVVNVIVPGTGTVNGVNVPAGFHKFAIGPAGMKCWYYDNR